MGAVIATRIEPLSTAIDLIVSDTLSPAAQKQAVATFARQRLAEAQDDHQRVLHYRPRYTRAVDGRLGALEETVNLPGQIAYDFAMWGPVIDFALSFLRGRAPYRSGRYQKSFVVLADGNQIDPRTTDIADVSEVTITNTQPYSRKIHTGAMKVSVPPGIFEDARQRVAGQFRGTLRADVRFIQLKNGYVLKGEGNHYGRLRGARFKRLGAGKPMTYPSLVLRLN